MMSSLECYYFNSHVRILRNGSYANGNNSNVEMSNKMHILDSKRNAYFEYCVFCIKLTLKIIGTNDV